MQIYLSHILRINNLKKIIKMNHFLLFGTIGAPEIIIIALIVLLLFGGKKIPEIARSLADGIKEFKKASTDDKQKKLEEKNGEKEEKKA